MEVIIKEAVRARGQADDMNSDTFSLTNDQYLLNMIKSITPLNTQINDMDNFHLLNYPMHYDKIYKARNERFVRKFMKIKDYRKIQLESFKKLLREITDAPKCYLHGNSSTMQYFNLHKKIQLFNFRSVEVSCRIYTYYDGSRSSGGGGQGDSSNAHLFKISSIKFKGELQEILEGLVKDCLETMPKCGLSSKTQVNNLKLYDAMAYTSTRCNHPNFPDWPCKAIEKMTLEKQPKLKPFHQQHIEKNKERNADADINLCFYGRQPIGYAFLPFIDIDNSQKHKSEEVILGQFPEELTEYNGTETDKINVELDEEYFCESVKIENNFIFDNIFIGMSTNMAADIEKSLMGIYKTKINYEADNFLSMGNDVCSALLDFTIHRIGVSRNGVNLNLLLKDSPVFCTKATCENNIPSAREYLTNIFIENEDIQKQIMKKQKKSIEEITNQGKKFFFDDDNTTNNHNNIIENEDLIKDKEILQMPNIIKSKQKKRVKSNFHEDEREEEQREKKQKTIF